MSKRITACIDDDVMKKLRMLQAKRILETSSSVTSSSVSLSEIINDVLRKQ